MALKKQTIAITTITLNSENTVARCLESVAGQTSPANDVVVVDGNSEDQTTKIIQQEVAKGLVTKYLSEPDQGISDAFNKAWKLTNSDYVCNLNSDDWLSHDYLQICQKYFAESEADILIGRLAFTRDSGTQWIDPKLPTEYPIKSWKNFAINHPGMVIKKSLLEVACGYDERYKFAMDTDLFLRLLKFDPKIKVMREAVVFQSDKGVSQRKWLSTLIELRNVEISHGRHLVAATSVLLLRIVRVTIKKLVFRV